MKKDVGMTTAQKSKETRRMESLFCISSQQSLHVRTLLRDVQFNADNNSDIKVHWLVVQNKTKRIELPLVTSLRLSHMCHSLVRNFSLSLSLSLCACVRVCGVCVGGWGGGGLLIIPALV